MANAEYQFIIMHIWPLAIFRFENKRPANLLIEWENWDVWENRLHDLMFGVRFHLNDLEISWLSGSILPATLFMIQAKWLAWCHAIFNRPLLRQVVGFFSHHIINIMNYELFRRKIFPQLSTHAFIYVQKKSRVNEKIDLKREF